MPPTTIAFAIPSGSRTSKPNPFPLSSCLALCAFIIWVIRNANEYYNKQLLDLYYKFSDRENAVPCKSNEKFVTDEWRYNKDNTKNYYLDYRVVRKFVNGLHKDAAAFIDDVLTVANNLGFSTRDRVDRKRRAFGRKVLFFLDDGDVLMEVKAYKNGNLHFKFSKDFNRALNIEAGRLNGWLKSAYHAAEEMGISPKDAEKYFKSNITIGFTEARLFLGRKNGAHCAFLMTLFLSRVNIFIRRRFMCLFVFVTGSHEPHGLSTCSLFIT